MLIEPFYNPLYKIWWDNIKFQAFYVVHLSPSNRIMTLAILIVLLDSFCSLCWLTWCWLLGPNLKVTSTKTQIIHFIIVHQNEDKNSPLLSLNSYNLTKLCKILILYQTFCSLLALTVKIYKYLPCYSISKGRTIRTTV